MTVDPGVVIAVIGALATALTTAAAKIYSDLKKDRDYWRTLAMMGTDLADKATTVAVRKSLGDG
jgi:hypothetical protein